MYIILVYDISLDGNEGQKVLRNVYKTCRKYLTHIQNSVFEGELNRGKMHELKSELDKWIRDEKDSLIVFHSRDNRWLNKEFWGREDDFTSKFF
jgi:CRISPR-associated protein Cas2